MHTLSIPQSVVARVIERRGREHIYENLDPAKTALVVVDMQNDFVREGGGLLVPDAAATIPAISALLELARAHGMHVVYSQDTHREGDPEWRPLREVDIFVEVGRDAGSWVRRDAAR